MKTLPLSCDQHMCTPTCKCIPQYIRAKKVTLPSLDLSHFNLNCLGWNPPRPWKNKLIPRSRSLGGGEGENGARSIWELEDWCLLPSATRTTRPGAASRQFHVVCHVIGRKIMASEGRSDGRTLDGHCAPSIYTKDEPLVCPSVRPSVRPRPLDHRG